MKKQNAKSGRCPKLKKKTHCVMVRFDDEEFARMLTLYEQSGVYAKAVFIKSRVFNEEFRVIKIDNSFPEYYAKLSDLYAQFRRIGVNYNQVTLELKSRFSEKKAMALLYKLEEQTKELVAVCHQITLLTRKFETEWLPK
ncbi:MAG: conjugal transfer protein MobA [Bacteroidales bacterium]